MDTGSYQGDNQNNRAATGSSASGSLGGGISVDAGSSGAGSGNTAGSSLGANSGDLIAGGSGPVSTSKSSVPRPRWMGKRVGRFRLLALLGQGAMGRVFRAEDTLMGRHVALKLLPRTLKTKGGASVGPEVLIREARAAAAIEHPNAVAVYEVNQAGDVCYVAMELLEGGSLRDLVRAAGPMDLTRACLLCAEAAEALAAAHSAGVVHRDVKPANLMLSRSGRCKVVDFGLARLDEAVAGGGGTVAGPGENVGTPQFIAPEILQGSAAGPASDLYSLGGTLFYLLTGRPPYEAPSARELLRMHVDAAVPDLRRFRPDASRGLADAIARALAKRPADRWASMEQFARVLRMHAIPTPADLPAEFAPPPTPSYFPAGSSSSIPSPGGASRTSRPASPMDAPLPAAELVEPAGSPRGGAAAVLDRLNHLAPAWAWMTGAGMLAAILIAILCIVLSRPAARDVAAQTGGELPAQAPTPPPPDARKPVPGAVAAGAKAAEAKVSAQTPPVAAQTQASAPATPPVAEAPAPAPHLTVLPHVPLPQLKIGDFEGERDIGDVKQRGLVNFDAPRHDYTVTGDGFDIFQKADSFHFIWRKMTGDLSLKANIRFIGSSPARFRKAALIVRQSLAPNAPFADIVMHGEGSVGLQYRRSAGEAAEQHATQSTGSTLWLVRHGEHFTGYLSSPGTEPQKVYEVDIPMADPVYVGLGVSARDKIGDRPETANFSGVELDSGARIVAPEGQ